MFFVGSSQWFGMLHVLEERDFWAVDSPARCREGREVAWAWLCRPVTHPVLHNAWLSWWCDSVTGENYSSDVKM